MPNKDTRKHSIIQTSLWNYAFVFMLVELADSLTIAVDSVFTKTLGPTALAARGMVSPAFMLCSIFSGVLAVGMRSYCSSAMSTGHEEDSRVYFSTGCVTAIVVAGILTAGFYLFLNPMVRICGADGSDPLLHQNLQDFLRGWRYSVPGYIGFFVLSPLVTLDGNKKCVTTASAVMLAENTVMDILAITVMDNGIWAIGLATGLSYTCGCLVLLTNFLRKHSAFRFSFRAIRPSVLPRMLRVGLPKLTRHGCKLLAPLFVNNLVIAVGGSPAMAALSMEGTIMALCTVPGNGISQSVNLFSEVYYSEKDRDSLVQMTFSALRLELLTCIPISVLAMVFAPAISAFYLRADPAAYRYGITALSCLSMAILLNAVNMSILSYLQGTRKMGLTHLQTISHKLFWQVVTTLVLSRTMGVEGLFYAIPASELFVLITYLCITNFSPWRGTPMDTFLLLPPGFCDRPENHFGFTVTSLDEVVGISGQIGDFCLSHGIDRRRAMFASLCAEELVANVVTHGFTKDTKPHSCDIRVMLEEGDVVLRIRDDCPYFNLKERYETIRTTESDVSAHVGIRLVYKIAKDIRYVNLLDTNTLIIRV